MAFLAVAYPHFSTSDHTWIQTIRQRYDSHYPLIEPHLTLVFPDDTLVQTAFVAHVTAQSASIRPIQLTFRCALVVKDAFSPATHVFLVPDQGFSAIVMLHDALYRDALAPARRLDVPFIPHITVGDFADPEQAQALVDHINQQQRSLACIVDAIDVIAYNHATITPITRIALIN